MGIKFNKIAMKLITDLGLNYTFFVQGILFLISYIFLLALFQAYYKAYLQRCNLVEGQGKKEEADKIQTQKFQEKYEVKLKDLNKQVQAIFAEDKKATVQKEQEIITTAQNSAEKLIADLQVKIDSEVNKQKEQITPFSQELSKVITKSVL